MRRLRAARKLTQEALASDCEIHRTYLNAVERSERNVSIDNIARIAKGCTSNRGSCSRMSDATTARNRPTSGLLVANWLPYRSIPNAIHAGRSFNFLICRNIFGAPEEIRTPDPQIRRLVSGVILRSA